MGEEEEKEEERERAGHALAITYFWNLGARIVTTLVGNVFQKLGKKTFNAS